MCGIAAVINCSSASERLSIFLKSLEHRGGFSDPIAEINPKIALGMRRLRILDWDNAIQPQWSFDNKFVLVFNGEIYNYRELRKDLEEEGIKFYTDGDTEVLANGIAKYGESFVSRLNGMFAFVAYDTETGNYIAARDTMGIKPLYYTQIEDGICFASEIKALMRGTEKSPIIPVPPSSIFTNSGIKKYTTYVSGFKSGTLTQNAKHLHQLLDKAVKERMPQDLPSAVMFSGGIDSTLILHYAKKYNPDVVAYFIGDDGGKDKKHVEKYASTNKVNLKFVDFDNEKVFNILEDVISTVESFEPNVIRNSIFSYLLSEQIHKDKIKVALCGEGADELFLGYPEFRLSKNIPLSGQNFLNDLHKTQLQRTDRCSMRFQLETRVPFLSPDIIDFANKIPPEQKIGFFENSLYEKIILRKVYDFIPELPRSIKYRKKVVFVDGAGMGDNNSISGPFYEYARKAISDNDFVFYKKKHLPLELRTKEEALYLSFLEKSIDINRVESIFNRPILNKIQTN